MNQMKLNDEQKAAVLCDENSVVAAGAGSGKTTVLANRFAWLITVKGYKVNEILTLTFTKKAASEMFMRIHLLLKHIAKEEGIEGERAKQALDDFIHSRIQTLDSYSASVVKQCASRYGISADFKVDDGLSREIALEECFPFLITYRHHPAVERLYNDIRLKDIVSVIFADVLSDYCLMNKKRNFKEDIRKQFDIICVEWNEKCAQIKTILNEIDFILREDPKLFPTMLPDIEKYKTGEVDFPDTALIRRYFDTILSFTSEACIEESENDPLQKKLAELMLYLSKLSGSSLIGKKVEIKDKVKQLREVYGIFSSLAVYIMQAGFVFSMSFLFELLQSKFLERKRAESVLTFRDIANLARTILLEQHDIRQSEKESFKAIMIDEFQDNNELQKELLFLLAEKPEIINDDIPKAGDLCPDKLFFVGDEKQSIYLFRDADVSVFRRLKQTLPGSNLTLKKNFRSGAHLIGAFNALFGGIEFDPLGKAPLNTRPSVFAPDGSLPFYEASYTPLEAVKDTESRLEINILYKLSARGASVVQELIDKDNLFSDESEARFVAEKIDKLLNEKKTYQPQDIAILFRSRANQYLFEKHLRLLNIPYNCDEIGDFFYGGLVNDIMSVLQLAAYPTDSASYAQMLRSPFAGLSLSGASVCLAIYNQTGRKPFSDETTRHLDDEDGRKYAIAARIYNSIYQNSSGSIALLVSDLWHNEGYRYETEWNIRTSVYRELYNYLFFLAVKADDEKQSLSSFIDSMRLLEARKRLKDIDIPLERLSAVRLMTIHKSKGLEFPVVFLCGCGKYSQAERSGGVYLSENAGLIFKPPLPIICADIPGVKSNYFWDRALGEIKNKRTAELRRLLYVGMTRAENELYISGSVEMSKYEITNNVLQNTKNYVRYKSKDNENGIKSDAIINNDTFFGLILPSIASHINENGELDGTEYFTLGAVTQYTNQYIISREEKSSNLKINGRIDLPNNQEGLNKYIEITEDRYNDAEIIRTPLLLSNRIRPVSFRGIDSESMQTASQNIFALQTASQTVLKTATKHGDADHFKFLSINKDFSGEDTSNAFNEVDAVLARFSDNIEDYDEKLNSGSFGTIAHVCVDAALNAKEPVIPPNLAGFLTPAQANVFLKAGKEAAAGFLRSPLGKLAREAQLRESEFSFRSLVKNNAGYKIFISGTIDLFFDDGEYIHIIDFKTDKEEIPSDHIGQTACYYHAVCNLYTVHTKKECRIWLYYLRTGHVVEMTERAANYVFKV
jgi:ATP-dependent helicase/nuclease subunit A